MYFMSSLVHRGTLALHPGVACGYRCSLSLRCGVPLCENTVYPCFTGCLHEALKDKSAAGICVSLAAWPWGYLSLLSGGHRWGPFCVLLREVSVQVSSSVSNGCAYVFLINFWNFLYILDTFPLSVVYFANVFLTLTYL